MRTVVGLSGPLVRLADTSDVVTTVALSVLQAHQNFAVLDRRERSSVPSVAALDVLPAAGVEQALWWERHILELMHGLPPDAASDALPRSDYDPQLHSLTQRERAKAAELVAAGHPVTASTVKHRRQLYQSRGLLGLVDHRVDKKNRYSAGSTPGWSRRCGPRSAKRRRTRHELSATSCDERSNYSPPSTGPGWSRCHRGGPSTGCSAGSRTGCTPSVLLAPGSRWPTVRTARSASCRHLRRAS